MSCYNPEKPNEEPKYFCQECPLASMEPIIDQQIESPDPTLRANGLSAKEAITQGQAVCGGPTGESNKSSCGISARKVCNNPNTRIALSLLNLSGALRKPS